MLLRGGQQPKKKRSLGSRSSSSSSNSKSSNDDDEADGANTTVAAHHITEECERLFCETLRAVFLVEKNPDRQTSLVMDATTEKISRNNSNLVAPVKKISSHLARDTNYVNLAQIQSYLEIWDYSGGARFRGFVAEIPSQTDDHCTRQMFIFFDRDVIGKDLKPGLMSLLELAGSEHWSCDRLVVAVDRTAPSQETRDLTRDLGWVGFELTLLDDWIGHERQLRVDDAGRKKSGDYVSDRWVFLSIEL